MCWISNLCFTFLLRFSNPKHLFWFICILIFILWSQDPYCRLWFEYYFRYWWMINNASACVMLVSKSIKCCMLKKNVSHFQSVCSKFSCLRSLRSKFVVFLPTKLIFFELIGMVGMHQTTGFVAMTNKFLFHKIFFLLFSFDMNHFIFQFKFLNFQWNFVIFFYASIFVLVRKAQDKLHATETKLQEAESNQADRVDKSLLKNLLIGYIMAPNNDKQQILKLISSVLDFNQQESDKVGLNRSNQGWLTSILHGSTSPNNNQAGKHDRQFKNHFHILTIAFFCFVFVPQEAVTVKTVWPKHLSNSWKMSHDHEQTTMLHRCLAWIHHRKTHLVAMSPFEKHRPFNRFYSLTQCSQHSPLRAIPALFLKTFSTILDTIFSKRCAILLVSKYNRNNIYYEAKNKKKNDENIFFLLKLFLFIFFNRFPFIYTCLFCIKIQLYWSNSEKWIKNN